MSEPEEKLMIRAHHTQALRYCKKGTKLFMESHGFDWDTFVKEGYPAEEILATNDAQAIRVVEFVRKETEDGRRR